MLSFDFRQKPIYPPVQGAGTVVPILLACRCISESELSYLHLQPNNTLSGSTLTGKKQKKLSHRLKKKY